MSYLEDSRASDEHVVWQNRQHWVRAFLPALVLLVVGVLTTPLAGLGLLLVALALPVALFAWLGWQQQEYAVTDRRLVAKVGVVRRDVQEVTMRQVESVRVDQSLWGRLLGYGDVLAVGSGGTRVVFGGVAEPLALRRHIQDQMAALRVA